ncbi:integrase arm-type DNA-binding domain-containing protein [Bartonella henselae]|uniref:tyrosine-type recombinase/integrase n=1 Tax=Bartonella henselae TaxID=38323 RepID=UPI001F41B4DF|nr:site-specific integrase [Bartonella henselae]UJM32680.1 integrase arm-type DNA-binding domain-containing protein [Bartonella henselae]
MRGIHQLSALLVKSASQGKYCDGAGLWLNVRKDNTRSWFFRYTYHNKRREMGLGPVAQLSLKEARELAKHYSAILREGNDPIVFREQTVLKQQSNIFSEIAKAAFESKKAELKNEGKNGRWFSPLELHVIPHIGSLSIEKLTANIIRNVLAPLWHEKADTARKALNRINICLKYAAALGLDVDLQACMKARALLGKPRATSTNIPAMPWQEVPAFYQSLDDKILSNLALKLLILTGVRSYPLRYLRLEQIDKDIWTIPKENMKGTVGKVSDFRVPLSNEALKVIEKSLSFEKNGFLFSGLTGKPISDASMAKYMTVCGLTYRPHGFRSSLRDWIAETTSTPFEIAETVLAHSVGSSVTKAYMRTDFLEQRHALLEQWAAFITGAT